MCARVCMCVRIRIQADSAYSVLVSSLRHTGIDLPHVLFPVCRLQKGFSQHEQVLVSTREMLLMKTSK